MSAGASGCGAGVRGPEGGEGGEQRNVEHQGRQKEQLPQQESGVCHPWLQSTMRMRSTISQTQPHLYLNIYHTCI